MKKIKIIQLGIGHDHAPGIMDTILNMPEIFEVAAIGATKYEQEHFAHIAERYKNIPVMLPEEAVKLPEIDAATIETEEINLTKYAELALENNLHVHMDKPGGFELADFERMLDTAKSKELIFHMGYMYRYNPVVMKALERVKNGELGKIYSVEAHMNCLHPKRKREWLSRFPGGMMFFLGCHLVDLIYAFQGKPDEIIPLNARTDDDVSSEDFGMAVFKYKNGTSFAKSCANEPGGFNRRQFVICGTKGTIEIRPLERHDGKGKQYTSVRDVSLENALEQLWDADGNRYSTDSYDRYEAMLGAFAKMVAGEMKNPRSYDYELEVYKCVLAACGITKKGVD